MRITCPSFNYEPGDNITIERRGDTDTIRLCFGDLWVIVDPTCVKGFARSLESASQAMSALLADEDDAA